jgi:predicted MPP superfamily phosphohydrolase
MNDVFLLIVMFSLASSEFLNFTRRRELKSEDVRILQISFLFSHSPRLSMIMKVRTSAVL